VVVRGRGSAQSWTADWEGSPVGNSGKHRVSVLAPLPGLVAVRVVFVLRGTPRLWLSRKGMGR